MFLKLYSPTDSYMFPQIVGPGLRLGSCGNVELWEHRHSPLKTSVDTSSLVSLFLFFVSSHPRKSKQKRKEF